MLHQNIKGVVLRADGLLYSFGRQCLILILSGLISLILWGMPKKRGDFYF